MYIFVEPTSHVLLTATHGRVPEGSSTTLECTAYGDPPINYSWKKNGEDLIKPTFGQNTVSLHNVRRPDAGKYTCIADNDANQPKTSNEVDFRVLCEYTCTICMNMYKYVDMTLRMYYYTVKVWL